MKKLVNGIEVELTSEEIAQRQAEEQEWAIKQEKQKIQQINILLKEEIENNGGIEYVKIA